MFHSRVHLEAFLWNVRGLGTFQKRVSIKNFFKFHCPGFFFFFLKIQRVTWCRRFMVLYFLCFEKMGEYFDISRASRMVSIFSPILALTSWVSDPMDPFFPKDTIILAVRTVVDGFLIMEVNGMTVGIIFRIFPSRLSIHVYCRDTLQFFRSISS